MYYGHHSSLLWLEVWQGFVSSCVEVLKGEKNGLICNKKLYMSLVQSCLISVGVQLVSTLGGEVGGGSLQCAFPRFFHSSSFSPPGQELASHVLSLIQNDITLD
jgi:hypothetical protein